MQCEGHQLVAIDELQLLHQTGVRCAGRIDVAAQQPGVGRVDQRGPVDHGPVAIGGGLGLLVEGKVERGYAYRSGFGVRLIESAIFGRPYVASLDAERETLGHHVGVAFEHPFFTDLQRIGWHTGYLTSNAYPGIRRPARDELALGVDQRRWDGSVLTRLFGTGTVLLAGAGASGVELTPAPRGVVVSDTGLAADTGTTLLNRYAPFKATRLGVLGGIRRVRFRTVRGFDALTAQQDVANGYGLGLFAAKSLPSLGESDVFLSGIAYAGAGRALELPFGESHQDLVRLRPGEPQDGARLAPARSFQRVHGDQNARAGPGAL